MIYIAKNPLKKYEDDMNRLFYKKEVSLKGLNRKSSYNYKEFKVLLISLIKELKDKTT